MAKIGNLQPPSMHSEIKMCWSSLVHRRYGADNQKTRQLISNFNVTCQEEFFTHGVASAYHVLKTQNLSNVYLLDYWGKDVQTAYSPDSLDFRKLYVSEDWWHDEKSHVRKVDHNHVTIFIVNKNVDTIQMQTIFRHFAIIKYKTHFSNTLTLISISALSLA